MSSWALQFTDTVPQTAVDDAVFDGDYFLPQIYTRLFLCSEHLLQQENKTTESMFTVMK